MPLLATVLTFILLAETPPADIAPAKAPASIESLAFMAGHWSSTDPEGGLSEELWLPPAGGLMVGVNRSVSPKGAMFEFLRIETKPAGVFYVAMPGGGLPTPFRLTASTATSATFENPQHDFPKRITYRRDGDTLVARIDGGPSAPDMGMEWRWTRKDK